MSEQLALWDWGLDMAALREEREKLLRSRRASSTMAAYSSAWADFEAWCREAGRSSLPADSETVSLYATWRLKYDKCSTVDKRLAAIAFTHRQNRQANPINPDVRAVVSGARRQRKERPKQAHPLTVPQLREVVVKLRGKPAAVRRDRAIILTAWAGALRRSELLALDLSDVSFDGRGAVLLVRSSKTDQMGKGRRVAIWPGERGTTCPVVALQAWLQWRGKEDGPLFLRVDPDGKLTNRRITTHDYNDLIKAAVASAGIDPAGYSGHSLRAGACTAAAASGASDLAVMQLAGHRSLNTTRQYMRSEPFLFQPLAKVGL